MLEALAISRHMEKNGWLVVPIQRGWRLVHAQTGQSLFMNISAHWLCLYATLPDRQAESMELAARVAFFSSLLQQNERSYMAKFCLDDEDALVLTVEVPLKSLNAPLLNKALGSLARYVEEYTARPNELGRARGIAPVDDDDFESGISKETFTRYMRSLDSSNWGRRQELNNFPWHIGYKSKLRVFEAYVTVTRSWAYFQVPILVDQGAAVLSADLADQVFFMQYLLRLNNTLFMAKLGLDANKQLLLLLEVPTETFDFANLQFITRTLSAYIDRCGQEVQIMAALQQDARLNELLLQSGDHDRVAREKS